MCVHRYTEEPRRPCVVSWIFDKFNSDLAPQKKTVTLSCDWELPIDSRGCCIFHSDDSTFKERNRFVDRFKDWIKICAKANKLNLEEAEISNCEEFIFTPCKTGYEVSDDRYIDLSEIVFPQPVSFDGSRFRGQVWFNYAHFKKSVNFRKCDFEKEAHFEQAVFHARAVFNGSFFHSDSGWRETEFQGSCQFGGCTFQGPAAFNETTFASFADFSKTLFNRAYFISVNFMVDSSNTVTTFDEARFLDVVEFKQSAFAGETSFLNCSFMHCEFIDTNFSRIKRTCFDGVKVSERLLFSSTSSDDKVFSHSVSFEITAEDIAGSLIFNNSNIYLISNWESIKHLADPSIKKIIVGPGCDRYRVRLDILVPLERQWKFLIVEMAETFVLFFEWSGVFQAKISCECEYQKDHVLVRYYSDFDISDSQFREALSYRAPEFVRLLENPAEYTRGKCSQNEVMSSQGLIEAFDIFRKSYSLQTALHARIATGKMTEDDFSKFLLTICQPDPKISVNLFQTINQIDVLSWKTKKLAAGKDLTIEGE